MKSIATMELLLENALKLKSPFIALRMELCYIMLVNANALMEKLQRLIGCQALAVDTPLHVVIEE